MQDFKNTTINAESSGDTVSIATKGTPLDLIGLLCETVHFVAQRAHMTDVEFLEDIVQIMVGDQLINAEHES